jgi:hypothetical protein
MRERDLDAKIILALLVLLVSAGLMEFAIAAHYWGAQALVWLFTLKWLLMLVFDLELPRSSRGTP